MPWVVHGQAGIAVRWVKDFLSGQWLCDQLGTEGSGCGHTLSTHSATHQPSPGVSSHQARQKESKPKKTECPEERQGGERRGSKQLIDGKGGVPSMHKKHSLKAENMIEGQEEGPIMSHDMTNVKRFWSEAADLSIAPSAEGSPFATSASAFQPGGSLYYLKPMFSDVSRRGASKRDEDQNCVETSGRVAGEAASDASSEPSHYGGRGRRGGRGAQKASAFLEVSVRTTNAIAESKASPSPQGSSDESSKKDVNRLKPASAPDSTQQRPLLSAQGPSLGAVDRRAQGSRTPSSSQSRDSDRRKAGGAAGPRSRALQGGVSGAPSRGAPAQGGAVKENRAFQFLNPLEVVAGFVEEVRDMVSAASKFLVPHIDGLT